MWIDMSSILSLFSFNIFFTLPLSPLFPSHLHTLYNPGCPSFSPGERFIRRDMSQKTTWRFLLALPWPPGERESLNSGPLFSPGFGSQSEQSREKAGEGLNVVVGAEAGMCPLYLCPFVGHDG